MSESPHPVSHAHFDYIAERTTQEDDLLRDLKAAADAAEIPRIWISAHQAAFFDVLLRATNAKEIVEVGTLAGYAAIWMARAVGDGGRVRTLEVSAKHAAFAREWIAKSDVADRVEVHEGDARATLKGFADGSADAMFIDADKDSYSIYLREALRIVRLGGLVLVDNAFGFGKLIGGDASDPDVAAISAVNEEIAACAALRSIIVPYGDGCQVCVKVAQPAATAR